jgi:hypothetical protein
MMIILFFLTAIRIFYVDVSNRILSLVPQPPFYIHSCVCVYADSPVVFACVSVYFGLCAICCF